MATATLDDIAPRAHSLTYSQFLALKLLSADESFSARELAAYLHPGECVRADVSAQAYATAVRILRRLASRGLCAPHPAHGFTITDAGRELIGGAA